MPADALATLEARVSAGIVLTSLLKSPEHQQAWHLLCTRIVWLSGVYGPFPHIAPILCPSMWKRKKWIIFMCLMDFECAKTWWHHQMKTFSALLAICAGNSPVTRHKGQWRVALIFFLYAPGWVNNREAGDLRRHRDHYDIVIRRKAHSQAVPLCRTDKYCSRVHLIYLGQAKSKIWFIQNVNISYNL